MDDRHALSNEILLQFAHPVEAFDDEAEMIELSFLGRLGKALGDFMDRQIVAARRQINVLVIRLPDHGHAEDFLIKSFRPPDIAHFERDVT